MRELAVVSKINPQSLDGIRYFETLLAGAYEAGLLDAEQADSIQVQLLALLARCSDSFHLGESSSIRVEHAEQLLGSITFTIGLCCKAYATPEQAIDALCTQRLQELYKQGRSLLKSRVYATRHLYELARRTRVRTNLRAYNDTLSKDGIGGFLAAYHQEFHAQSIPGTIDYPLAQEVGNLSGVEYISAYLNRLVLENRFCACFAPDTLDCLLRGVHMRYEDLLHNICRQAYAGALCCVLCGREAKALYYTAGDVSTLGAAMVLDTAGAHAAITRAAQAAATELGIQEDGALAQYLHALLPGIAAEALAYAKQGLLHLLFPAPIAHVIRL